MVGVMAIMGKEKGERERYGALLCVLSYDVVIWRLMQLVMYKVVAAA